MDDDDVDVDIENDIDGDDSLLNSSTASTASSSSSNGLLASSRSSNASSSSGSSSSAVNGRAMGPSREQMPRTPPISTRRVTAPEQRPSPSLNSNQLPQSSDQSHLEHPTSASHDLYSEYTEYLDPSWMLSSEWSLTTEMDAKSKAVIEHMLAEEEFYFGKPSDTGSSAVGSHSPVQDVRKKKQHSSLKRTLESDDTEERRQKHIKRLTISNSSVSSASSSATSSPTFSLSHQQQLMQQQYQLHQQYIQQLQQHQQQLLQQQQHNLHLSQHQQSQFSNVQPSTPTDNDSTETEFESNRKSRSSAHLPSHNTRWNADENARFREGIKRFGHGNWKAIAEVIGTRNALQVKNHARHLLNAAKGKFPIDAEEMGLEGNEMEDDNDDAVLRPKLESDIRTGVKRIELKFVKEMESKSRSLGAETQQASSVDEHEEDLDIDIGSPEISSATTVVKVEEKAPLPAPGPDLLDDNETVSVDGDSPLPDIEDTEAKVDQIDELEKITDAPLSVPERSTSATPVAGIDSENAHIETPDYSKISSSRMRPAEFLPDVISVEEMAENQEFFQGKASKTPGRYLKIRNHILMLWNERNPHPVTKTAIRPGLKDCGDVNAIGRVHSYLERCGAINIGLNQHDQPSSIQEAEPKQRSLQGSTEQAISRFAWDQITLLADVAGPRKRRVRNHQGVWVDEKDLEGKTIAHDRDIDMEDEKQASSSRQKSARKKTSKAEDMDELYDPFTMIHPERHSAAHPAPFQVLIHSNVMIVMDLHAHLATTEIIGLLGGRFLTDKETPCLEILLGFPCKSMSTGFQCEMDPSSEMKAREVFAERGLQVVGWYHSHPQFAPNPSVRDIENQTAYQELFRLESGVEPFVGIIVSPFDKSREADVSDFRFFSVSKQKHACGLFGIPLVCDKKIQPSPHLSAELFGQLRDLIQAYRSYEHRVDWMQIFRKRDDEDQTCMEKILASLRAHMYCSDDEANGFIRRLRNFMLEVYLPHATAAGAASIAFHPESSSG